MSELLTFRNPYLVERLDEIYERDAPAPVFRGADLDWRMLERRDEASANQTQDELTYQRALELHEQVLEDGKGFQRRAAVRWKVADYLRQIVSPHARRAGRGLAAREYDGLAEKLEQARPWGVWGYDPDEDKRVYDSAQRAGLVKLCPDDARDEAMRLAATYVPRIEFLQEQGYVVQFWVLTKPNAPRGYLADDIKALHDDFRRKLFYARSDGREAKSIDDPRRVCPELVGAMTTLETPLSAAGDWNVHLNALMVFRERPDWEAYRQAWGYNVEMREVPTGAAGPAMRELIKYATKATSDKSLDERKRKRDRRTGKLLPPPPPMIEWAPFDFEEWWIAHKGLRRTRSLGCLNANKRSKWGAFWEWLDAVDGRKRKRKRDLDRCEWLGKFQATPTRFHADRPMPCTLEHDRRQRAVDWIPGNIFDGDLLGDHGPGPPLPPLDRSGQGH